MSPDNLKWHTNLLCIQDSLPSQTSIKNQPASLCYPSSSIASIISVSIYSWWKPQCWLENTIFLFLKVSLCSATVCRHESGASHFFPSYLTIFVKYNLWYLEVELKNWNVQRENFCMKITFSSPFYILAWYKNHTTQPSNSTKQELFS